MHVQSCCFAILNLFLFCRSRWRRRRRCLSSLISTQPGKNLSFGPYSPSCLFYDYDRLCWTDQNTPAALFDVDLSQYTTVAFHQHFLDSNGTLLPELSRPVNEAARTLVNLIFFSFVSHFRNWHCFLRLWRNFARDWTFLRNTTYSVFLSSAVQ